ncbi:MAG: sodium:proton antiporter [Gemmatimonadales bacterium]|nr:sodium:proton antiporter [Gemmatimonadales bacterium]
MEHLLIGLATIIVLGMGAQWLSWRLRLPAILFLLIVGFLAGPVAGIIEPDALLGDLLFPIVSLSVAVILFEGGLSLDIAELRVIGRAVRGLITIGVLLTWWLSAALAHWLLGLDLALAALFGAVLVVTGPTVIIPLLRHIRPKARIGSTVKWEGIVNDPIGAILGVLVFEAIVAGGVESGLAAVLAGMLRATVVGGGLGLAAAGLVVVLLKRYWMPDYLQSPASLAIVVLVYAVSNMAQPESGLLAVTAMGAALASQRFVSVKTIVVFKENLRVLLISGLFIILAARLPLADPDYWSAGSVLFVTALVFIVRPVAVAAATWNSGLDWRERLFLAAIAPRGIVAAAVASVFAIELVDSGHPAAARLVPLMFLVIVGTVAAYGLFSPLVARWLGIATPNPQGVLIIGAVPWVRRVASLLRDAGVKVVLTDSNWANVAAARRDGLPARYANALTEGALEELELELDGVGRLLALTSNDEVNALATLHFADLFDRSQMFQLPPESSERERRQRGIPLHLRGRFLFSETATHGYLAARFERGAVVKRSRLTEEYDFAAFRRQYGEAAVPMFVIRDSGELVVITAAAPVTPRAGQTLISLVDPID